MLASPFDTITGLPVHALVVHAVVVLLPLACVGAIAMAIRPDWSRRYGLFVIGGGAISTVAAYIARESGEQLASRVGWQNIERHQTLGNWVVWVGLLVTVLTLALWWTDRADPVVAGRAHSLSRSAVGKVLAFAVIAAALGAGAQTVLAGHSGSAAVWEQVIKNTVPGSQPRP